MKQNSRKLSFAIVFLVFGFLLSFSYSLTKDQFSKGEQSNASGNRYGVQEELIRKELVGIQQQNIKLQESLYEKQDIIREFEQKLFTEDAFSTLTEKAEEYRMILGKVAVIGPGVTVTLEDGEYDPTIINVNDYLVHEHHVFNVMDELLIAGAEAISINGQRIRQNSYIICNGPVITIDGSQYPAPFIIKAIGDQDVLESALNITGGIKDQLVNDNVVFTLEKDTVIEMEPVISDS